MGWFKKIFGGSKRRSSRPIRTNYEERRLSPDKPRSSQGTDKDNEDDESSAKRSAEDNGYSHNHNNGYESGYRYPPYYDNHGGGTWDVGYQGYESPTREQHGNWLTDLWNHYSNVPQSRNEVSTSGFHDPYYGGQGSNSYGDPHYGHVGTYGAGNYGEQGYSTTEYPTYYGEQGHSTTQYPIYYGEQSHSTTEYPTYYGEQGHSTTQYPIYNGEQSHSTTQYPTYYGEQVHSATKYTTNYGERRCYICQTSLSQVYRTTAHPFWRQTYCAEHEHDGTPLCESCHRYKSSDEKYISLVDGRLICPKCRKTAIMDREACKELYRVAKRFYERLGMEIESYIPIHLVDAKAMRKLSGHDHSAGVTVMSEETVVTIIGVDDGDDDVITRTYELDGDGVPKGILLLYGFPRLMAGVVIAHELMHVWLRLQGYQRLDGEVEEGMAQVMAHRWLCSEMEDLDCGWSKRLVEYLKYYIEANDMPNYGSGYRKGIAAVQRYGLKGTLDHIRSTGEFPW